MNETISHQDHRGCVRRSAQERHKLIEAYQSSGLGKAAFCRLHKIHLGTFCGWMKKRSAFVEVNLPHEGLAGSPIRQECIQIDLPRGLCVRVYDARLLKILAPFIRKMLAC